MLFLHHAKRDHWRQCSINWPSPRWYNFIQQQWIDKPVTRWKIIVHQTEIVTANSIISGENMCPLQICVEKRESILFYIYCQFTFDVNHLFWLILTPSSSQHNPVVILKHTIVLKWTLSFPKYVFHFSNDLYNIILENIKTKMSSHVSTRLCISIYITESMNYRAKVV